MRCAKRPSLTFTLRRDPFRFRTSSPIAPVSVPRISTELLRAVERSGGEVMRITGTAGGSTVAVGAVGAVGVGNISARICGRLWATATVWDTTDVGHERLTLFEPATI